MDTPLIQTVDLVKYFNTKRGPLHAVDHVNLSIKKGETLGVVGESGCGKSTLGRTILRLLEPTSGSVLYNGDDIVKYSPQKMKEMRKKMQIIFQDPFTSLNPRMSVSEIIAEPMITTKTYTNAAERLTGISADGNSRTGRRSRITPILMSWMAEDVSVLELQELFL